MATSSAAAGRSRAEAALHRALRDLYIQAGEPSSRSIASAVGDVSHSTVNSALRGTKVPSWPILSKIVTQLSGDEEAFRDLWSETRGSGSVIDPLPTATSITTEVSVFVSYARVDDEATYSRISKVVDDIATAYRSMTGRAVGIFKDTDSIEPGENWKDRIRLGLSASSIFLAFVSPAYLRSPMCRQELSEFTAFLATDSTMRLVVPLVFASVDRIERHFGDDELWQELSRRNRLDVSALRSTDPGSSGWIELVQKIADRIDDVLSSDEVSRGAEAGFDSSPIERDSAAKSSAGDLDLLAELESDGPNVTAHIERAGALLEGFGQATVTAAPEMLKASTFGQKLAVSKRLAEELEPIADELDVTVDEIHSGLEVWNKGIGAATSIIRRSPDEARDPRVQEFLRSIRDMATTSSTSLSELDSFHSAMGDTMGFSASLDKPLRKMRAVTLRMAELRGIFQNWLGEVEALDSWLQEGR